MKGIVRLLQTAPQYAEAAPFPPFPQARWFLAVYIRDVWQRLSELLAAATSVHGSILKIDSTKKVCRKLLGAAAKTANWATNVSNERGEVLISVLTSQRVWMAWNRWLMASWIGLIETIAYSHTSHKLRYSRGNYPQPIQGRI